MSLPWLQVAVDAFEKAEAVAATIGVEDDKALAMLLRLWRFVVASAPKDSPPTGLIPVEDAPAVIAGVMRWKGDRELLIRALIRYEFLELKGADYRVRGTSRYVPIWKKNQRPFGGARPETGEKPGGTRADAVRNPGGVRPDAGGIPVGNRAEDVDRDRDVETTEKTSSPPAGTHAGAQAGAREASVPGPEGDAPRPSGTYRPVMPPGWVPEAPDTPPETWTGQQFWCWFQARRVASGYVPERPPDLGKVERWWAEARRYASVERLQAGAYRFGEAPHWDAKNVPFSGFARCYADFTPPEVSDGA